jgi:hypothetical protein
MKEVASGLWLVKEKRLQGFSCPITSFYWSLVTNHCREEAMAPQVQPPAADKKAEV